MRARLSLAAVSLVAALVVMELAVRTWFPETRDTVIPGGIFTSDEELGWRLAPNVETVHQTSLFEARYATNSLGFRDRERSPVRDAKKRRILLFGDSHVFGWGVDVSERVSERIEAVRPDLEVWNFGVPAYGLDQEILSYSRNAAGLLADVVVFQVSASILERARLRVAYDKPKPRFRLGPNGTLRLEPPEGTKRWELAYQALSSLHLPYFLNQRWVAARHALAGEEQRTLHEMYSVQPLDGALLELARAQALARGHEIVFLSTLGEDEHAAVFGRDDDVEIAHVPQNALQSLRFGATDRHWTPAGHALVAGTLLESEAISRRAR